MVIDALRRATKSFAPLHLLNFAANIGYSLIQLIVFARVLDFSRYAEVVILLSVGFYLQPIDQAFGRANFVMLRRHHVSGALGSEQHEVSLSLAVDVILMTLLCLAIPFLLSSAGVQVYAENVLILVVVLLTNAWSFNLQSIALATDLAFRYSALSFIRRLTQLVAIIALWLTRDLLVFGLVAGLSAAVFHLIALVAISRRTALISLIPRYDQLTVERLSAYLRQVFTSFSSAVSELVVLNSTYFVLTVLHGPSPMVVVFDSIMKVARLVNAAARTLTETQLPGVSRLLLNGERQKAEQRALWLGAVCLCGALIPALVIWLDGGRVFQFLLGPNNLVPAGAMLPAGVIVVVSTLYQLVSVLLSYGVVQRPIHLLTWVCLAGFAISAVAIGLAGEAISIVLWCYSIYCFACLLIGAILTRSAYRQKIA